MDFQTLERNIDRLAAEWAPQRSERMARQGLEKADFAALAEAGMTLTGVPVSHGGLWDPAGRPWANVAALLRKLATADPSLALVTAMHPTVLLNWINDAAEAPPGWQEQRAEIFGHVRAGAWFGTISSEPGAGGDFLATLATARPVPGSSGSHAFLMSGDKYMGSGSGVTSFMMTTARPEGEDLPEIFLLDCRGVPWDGSRGVRMVRAWDGAGMAATQSHAFRFDDAPVTRHGLLGAGVQRLPQNSTIVGYLFSSVFLGILDAASAEARTVLKRRADKLSGFEETKFVEGLNAAWLAGQALAGMEAALGTAQAGTAILHGKLAIADLAERALGALSHAIGGGSMSRSSPYAQWIQDIRALGHLRPPRPLTYAKLLETE
ncbi:MAG: hypothetical protein AB7F96_08910 [Beijerinckiaceae bacterium]